MVANCIAISTSGLEYRLLHNEYVLTESSKTGNYPTAGGCQGLVVKETLKGIQDLIGPTDNADCTAMCGCVCVCVHVNNVRGSQLSRGGGQKWNCQGEGARVELSRGGGESRIVKGRGKSGIVKGREAKVKTR